MLLLLLLFLSETEDEKMFGNQKVVNTIAVDQQRIDGACGFIESLMNQVQSAKTSTQDLIKEIEEKKNFYAEQQKRLTIVHDFCEALEGAAKR